MKKRLLFLILLVSQYGFSVSTQNINQDTSNSIVRNKNTNIEEKLTYNTNLKDKYNDSDFIYNDDIRAKKAKESLKETTSNGLGFLSGFASFMTSFFPYILGIIIVFIIVKVLLGSDVGFWNFKKSKRTVADTLIYEDEDIENTNFSKHIENAISNHDYRLATRYYYLSLLKKLSDKKAIKYHKDKTNTEYIFEIENTQIREQFSKVSYIYNYVWYGEFPIGALKFKTIVNTYKSILNSIN